MQKIMRVSLIFRIIFQIIFIALPILTILFWAYTPASLEWRGVGFGMWFASQKVIVLHPLSMETRLFGFLINIIPIGLLMAVSYSLIQLFRLYEKQIIFTLKNVQSMKRTGLFLLFYEIARPFSEAATTALLTWHNPHGHRIATISFSGINLTVILTAIMIILISWIMAEGCKLQEEQQLTI